MALTISPYSITPSIHTERRLTRFTRVCFSLSFAFPSCTLIAKLKSKSSAHSFEWSIMLCDDKEEISRAALFGVVVPFVAISLAKVVCRPWIDKFMNLFEDKTHEKEVDLEKQEEAERIASLMRPTAERIRNDEQSKLGLLIIEAKYGAADASGTREYPLMGAGRVVDVTIALQAMVNDSQLRIYYVKSQLPGFYDPCPGEPKVLLVKYRFRGEAHAVAVADEAQLAIPLRAHRLTSAVTENGLERSG